MLEEHFLIPLFMYIVKSLDFQCLPLLFNFTVMLHYFHDMINKLKKQELEREY